MAMKNDYLEQLKRDVAKQQEQTLRHTPSPAVIRTTTTSGGTSGGARIFWDDPYINSKYVSKDTVYTEQEKRFKACHRITKESFEKLTEAGKKEIVTKLTLDLAQQLVQEYVGCIEDPLTGTLEFGIDVRVKG